MKKSEALEFLQKFEGEDIVIRTPEQEQEFLTNYKGEVVEKEVKPIIGEIHSNYEKDIAELTGEAKPEGMKAYEWNKLILKKGLDAKKKVDTLNTQIAALEQQVKDGTADEAMKQKIDELTNEVSRLESHNKETVEQYKSELEKEKANSATIRKQTDLSYKVAGMKFLPDDMVMPAVRQTYIDKVMGEIVSISSYDDNGKMYFKDTEGNIMRNEDSSVKTPEQILCEKLEPILDKGKQQPGVTVDKTKSDGKTSGEVIAYPSSVTTLRELTAFLKSKGMNSGDPKYIATFKQAKENKMPPN